MSLCPNQSKASVGVERLLLLGQSWSKVVFCVYFWDSLSGITHLFYGRVEEGGAFTSWRK